MDLRFVSVPGQTGSDTPNRQCLESMTHDEASILDALLELEGGLSGRELDFIEDINEYRVLNIKLTEKQSDWLKLIGNRLL